MYWLIYRSIHSFSLIKYMQRNCTLNKSNNKSSNTTCLCVSYAGLTQEHIVRYFESKIRGNFKMGINIKFKVPYSTYNVSSYTNKRDLTTVNFKFNVI